MKGGNILLVSLMLSEAVENHLSFILCSLKTKSVNKPTRGNLSHDVLCAATFRGSGKVGVLHLSIWLHVTERWNFVIGEGNEEKKGGGPNSREDVTNPAAGPCASTLESHCLARSSNWKQMHSVFSALPVSGPVGVFHERVA